MRIGFQLALAACLGLPMTELAAPAQESTNAFANTADKVGYAIGMNVGRNLKRAHFEINLDEMMNGIKDVLADQPLKLTDQQAGEAIMAYQQQRIREVAEKNDKETQEFLAENAKKEGVKSQTVTMPDGKSAQFQYKVITEGTGEVPKSNDVVSINYHATLLNGKELPGPGGHGQQAQFPASRALTRGVAEAVQMMKTGSKWELYLPAVLAFGEQGNPRVGIDPGTGLAMEVELVSTGPQQPPPTTSPMTSDVIRVPSADEMKHGSNIQVLSREEVERMTAGHTNQTRGK